MEELARLSTQVEVHEVPGGKSYMSDIRATSESMSVGVVNDRSLRVVPRDAALSTGVGGREGVLVEARAAQLGTKVLYMLARRAPM